MSSVNPGDKFSRLTVVSLSHKVGSNKVWNCLCSCGNQTKVYNSNLTNRTTKSCGCLKTQCTHGEAKDRSAEYIAWQNMKSRCYDSSRPGYELWGGRGITVCDRWKNSYETFLQDMGRRPNDNYSLDRINNDGNYTPENCRWASKSEQESNKTKLVTCRKGHPLIGDNIVISTDGRVRCAICKRVYANAYYARLGLAKSLGG